MKKYAETHEYVDVEGNVATVGISEDAADQLGDVTEVMFPKIGETVKKGDSFFSIESVKAVQDIYAPVSGKVIELNTVLADTPELINDDPEGRGWILKIEMSDPAELDTLLDQDPV